MKAHPDMIHKESGAVVELKTTNSTKVMKEPYSSHLKQLKTYMNILKVVLLSLQKLQTTGNCSIFSLVQIATTIVSSGKSSDVIIASIT